MKKLPRNREEDYLKIGRGFLEGKGDIRGKINPRIMTEQHRWLWVQFIPITIALALLYIGLHFYSKVLEQQFLRFDQEQIDFIVNIKLDSSIENQNDKLTLIHDYLESSGFYEGAQCQQCTLPIGIAEPFKKLSPNLLRVYLTEHRFKRASPFWLIGDFIYLEVVFWSLFGVLASLLYHVSEAIRQGSFNSNEVTVHWAKLIYSPLIAIVIIISIDVFVAGGHISVEGFSNWLVVMSFILGFYSRRAIDLLDRVKDLFFRSSDKQELQKVQPDENVSLSEVLNSNQERLAKLPNFVRAYEGMDNTKERPTPCIIVELSDNDDSQVMVPLGYEANGFFRSVPTKVIKNVKREIALEGAE